MLTHSYRCRELQFVREKIEQRRPSGMLLSTLSPCDRVEESERYQIMVEKVLEEIHVSHRPSLRPSIANICRYQLLVNANPADLATELSRLFQGEGNAYSDTFVLSKS